MNERIKELANKAGLKVNADGEIGPAYFGSVDAGYRKFAELIVRECVQTLIDNTPERYTNESAEEDWDKGYDRAMTDCVHHIKQHFGVDK